MNRPTQTIELPETKIKVDIKTWINGKEAEYIEAPLFKAATLTGKSSDGEMNIGIDAENAIHEQNHRIIECRVSKVQTESEEITIREKILEFILNEIPDSDYTFILSEVQRINTESKKK